MLQFNSALLASVGSFTGAYAPYQGIHIRPHQGGVLLIASDHGKVTALGFDRQGRGDETLTILPSNELLKACAGIKTAQRDVVIENESATVTTYYKTSAKRGDAIAIKHSLTPFPPIDGALADLVQRWGQTPAKSDTAGRYQVAYLERAIKAAGYLADSTLLCAFDGGPLRIQGESIELLILVMPQTAQPIPELPDWLQVFGASTACHSTHSG